jgi:hypothetical protein
MSRQLEQYGINILQLHVKWLQDQGPSYKQQAASAKRQIRMILINKRKATSAKQQASRPALMMPQLNDNRIIKENKK